jgi:hypothetical protein
MGRAQVFANAHSPGLNTMRGKPDGTLEDAGEVRNDKDSAADIELIAQLLGLLVTFIGESLTLLIVLDAWPDLTDPDSTIFQAAVFQNFRLTLSRAHRARARRNWRIMSVGIVLFC